MSRRRSVGVLAAALLTLVFGVPTACSRPPGGAEGSSVLRYRLNDDPPDLDPVRARDITSEAILFGVFDGLVELDPRTLQVVPAVAERWEARADGREFTFHLRRGVRFHNGREVEAADVVYSFERALRPANHSARPWVFEPLLGAAEFQSGAEPHVEGLKALDRYTVRLTLSRPYGPFLSHLVLEQASLVPHEVYDDPTQAYLRHPVGCGPFRFSEWTSGQSVVLDAFDDYYGEGPFVDRVAYRIVRSQETALEEYRAGNLDVADEVPSGKREAIQAEMGEQFHRWPQMAIRGIALNHAKPPFAGNLALRKAANHAVDRDYLLRVVDEGKDQAIAGVIPPGLPGFDPGLTGYSFDPARARDLLVKAGYPEGRGLPRMTLLYNDNEGHRRMCARIASDLNAVGIPVEPRSLDFASYLQAITGTAEAPPKEEMVYFAWVGDFADAYNFLFANLYSANRGTGGNYARYSNAEVDRLLDEAVALPDAEARAPLYRRAEAIAVEDAAWIFLYAFRDEALVRPEVEGLVLSPLGDFASPLHLVRLRPRQVSR
jgi:peptide/nickel transport system substrate-binding protein/oligopeptide transport system substrate-binding protein